MSDRTRILYVMGRDSNNIKVLLQVMMLAKEHRASLTLLDVIDSLPSSSRMLITSVPIRELKNSIVQNRLDQLETLVASIGTEAVEMRPRVLFGNYAKEIVHEATDGGYDLVIKNPGKGSNDRYLVRNCHCPVWLLTPDQFDASGQLIRSRFPAPGTSNGEPRIGLSATNGSEHRANWFSRAQAFFW